jgi:flagellar biosynthesis protein FlhG
MNRSLKSLRTYLEKGGETPRWAPTPGVVVVGAGKGGVGTSTISALLALAGAREGRRVLLVDGDEGVGSLHLLMGLTDPGPGLGDLRGGELTPHDLLHPLAQSLWLLPGGGGGGEATLSTSLGERRALFRRVSTLYEEFDLVVLDGGSHLASVLAACSAGAERLLALTTHDRVAMAATYALLKVTQDRFPHLPVEILVNFGEDPSSDEVFRMMSVAGNRFLGLQPGFAGCIPADAALQTLRDEGAPLSALNLSARASEATGLLHSRLAAEQESAQADGTPVLPLSFFD